MYHLPVLIAQNKCIVTAHTKTALTLLLRIQMLYSIVFSKARDLVFTLCRFHLGTEQFRDLLMRTSCQKLNLELSQFDDDILNDYVS